MADIPVLNDSVITLHEETNDSLEYCDTSEGSDDSGPVEQPLEQPVEQPVDSPVLDVVETSSVEEMSTDDQDITQCIWAARVEPQLYGPVMLVSTLTSWRE